jgi:DNA invertase Pin-like site-specific DNA recombinase
MALATVGDPSVHGPVGAFLVYVRRSYKEATAADLSDELQEAACRALLPDGATVRVISDSGGHHSGASADRDGYQALLGSVRAGGVAGIVVYDLSRLARNARLMLDLHHQLEAQHVPLLVANLPGARFDGATGRYMFGQLALAAQLQRDLDAERMTSIQRHLFEEGRHRGHDPFGYRSRRDGAGTLIRPRQLEVVPEEAAIVRRIVDDLASLSFDRVTDRLNADGVPGRADGPWTRDGVKDIWRRGRVYLGYVVEKRGRDERPGCHPPILSEAAYRRACTAVAARRSTGQMPLPYRAYPLRGLLVCVCGTRMRGEAHVQRGGERRYYRCPTVACRERRVAADVVEGEVMAAIGEGVLAEEVLAAARRELRRRLESPATVSVGKRRARLTRRLEQLQKQHAWGDLADAAYQKARDETRTALAELPDGDRVVAFDAYRTRVLELRDAIAVASAARREELCRIVVEQVVVADRHVAEIVWTPPARPFFEKRQRVCPQGDSNP